MMEMVIPFGAQFGVKSSVTVGGQRPHRYDPVSQKTQELCEDGVWRAQSMNDPGTSVCYCTEGGTQYCSLAGDNWYSSGCYYDDLGLECKYDQSCGGYDWSDSCADLTCY